MFSLLTVNVWERYIIKHHPAATATWGTRAHGCEKANVLLSCACGEEVTILLNEFCGEILNLIGERERANLVVQLARFFVYVFPDFTILRAHAVTVYTVSRACASIYSTGHLYYSWQADRVACCWRYIGLRFAGSTAVLCTTAGSFASCLSLLSTPLSFVLSFACCWLTICTAIIKFLLNSSIIFAVH